MKNWSPCCGIFPVAEICDAVEIIELSFLAFGSSSSIGYCRILSLAGPSIVSCRWVDFYFCVICQMMPLKVWPKNSFLGCNHQSTCMPQLQPLCSAAMVSNVLLRRDEGLSGPCAVDQFISECCSWSTASIVHVRKTTPYFHKQNHFICVFEYISM